MLQKGFISGKRELLVPRDRLIIGAIVWLPYVVILYLLFTGFREILRFAMFDAPASSAGFFSDGEAFYYNFFFAFWFCLVGFSQTIELLATSVSAPRLERYLVLNDSRTLVAFFTYYLPKILSMFAIFCMAMPVLDNTNFIREFWYFYPLLTTVLFMSQWMRITRRFRNSMKWMFVTLGIFIVTSSVLAFFPLISHRTTQQLVLDKRPDLRLSIDLPESITRLKTLRIGMGFRVYYGAVKDQLSDTLLVYEKSIVGRDELPAIIADEREKMFSSEADASTMLLYADRSISVKVIRDLLAECRVAGLSWVRFMATPAFVDEGVEMYLRDSLTSGEEVFRGVQETPVRLRKGIITVGDKEVSNDELKQLFERQIADTTTVVLDIDTESKYESYVRLYDIIAQAEEAVTARALGKDNVRRREFRPHKRGRLARVVELTGQQVP